MEFEIREVRKPQGRKKLVREREEYFRLMQLGFNSEAACRIVGINERTGVRWRNGYNIATDMKRVPPIRLTAAPSSSRYLSETERVYLADRLRDKVCLRTIAAEMGRSPSTISREIARNRHPINGSYRPHAAHARAQARRPRPKPGKIGQDQQLHDFIQRRLELKWSPEQICQSLRQTYPDRPEMQVSHETIYQALYVQGRGELRRELVRALRTGRARRVPRRQAQQRRARYLGPKLMISQRPAEADDRAVPGHWEGDLIIGKDHKSAMGTLVERSTRYVMLVGLPSSDLTAETLRDALIDTVKTLPLQLKRSLTWDQGSEMAMHQQFSLAVQMPVYFCDPHSPWQRGTNENTNGLLRQYFPKGTDLSVHPREYLDAVAAELNARPRKTLGWKTPAECLATVLTS